MGVHNLPYQKNPETHEQGDDIRRAAQDYNTYDEQETYYSDNSYGGDLTKNQLIKIGLLSLFALVAVPLVTGVVGPLFTVERRIAADDPTETAPLLSRKCTDCTILNICELGEVCENDKDCMDKNQICAGSPKKCSNCNGMNCQPGAICNSHANCAGDNVCYKGLCTDLVLMVVGGYSNEHKGLRSVEVIDIVNDQRCGGSVPNVPEAVWDATGFFDGDRVLVCGGATEPCTDCWEMGHDMTWTLQKNVLTQDRESADSIQLTENTWLIVGDNNPMEMYDKNTGTFMTAENLPQALENFHVVPISVAEVMILGGDVDIEDGGTSASYIYNHQTGEVRTATDSQIKRENAIAGAITLPDGRVQVVLTAGDSTLSTQIYDVATGVWSTGPDFPSDGEDFELAVSVQSGNTFYVVGGEHDNRDVNKGNSNKIVFFNPNSLMWESLDTTLNVEREDLAALMVPRSFAKCGTAW